MGKTECCPPQLFHQLGCQIRRASLAAGYAARWAVGNPLQLIVMQSDEEQIRQQVATWMAASKSGDVDTVLNLVAEDVVFLVPGRPPMRKAEFAKLSGAQSTQGGPKIDGTSEIQEIKVLDDWAFMWTKLTVVATPPDGSAPIERSGHGLTILKKEDGKWLIARDANLLSPVQRPEA
jgi:uncharacterized protein (TIGR02246 family)